MSTVLLASGSTVEVVESPEEVMAERSRALGARFPSGNGSDVMVLTSYGNEGLGGTRLDPSSVEGAFL